MSPEDTLLLPALRTLPSALCSLLPAPPPGAYMFRREWRRGPTRSSRPFYQRLLILTLCGGLYMSLWGSYLYYNAEIVSNGDKIKLRDALGNFMKSPAVQVSHIWQPSEVYIFANDIV